eukprot:CAMPEP_0198124020 /NCGR_PEP_ID=MMETSP1442-20131203/38921_1 /TAXON_ID= /ORGANISM="Craspedostauros australis, Strain CCMP3328" /LENGTH=130 /DNA_ID=CAMNT_0043783337 /DNA_START=36 /DNA_END=428 /DNA_ORIENTATION=-
MKTISIALLLALIVASANAFVVSSQQGSAFVISQRQRASTTAAVAAPLPRTGASSLHMGGKNAKFGIFSPAVYGAKVVLGTPRLNKLRGKGISLHSQAIGEFCEWAGAYHLRTRLIKLAKTNGDTLGFLV